MGEVDEDLDDLAEVLGRELGDEGGADFGGEEIVKRSTEADVNCAGQRDLACGASVSLKK